MLIESHIEEMFLMWMNGNNDPRALGFTQALNTIYDQITNISDEKDEE